VVEVCPACVNEVIAAEVSQAVALLSDFLPAAAVQSLAEKLCGSFLVKASAFMREGD
jgi:hypothetical protein